MHNPPVTPHIISVFQRPRQGTSILNQHIAYKYKHRIMASAGFESASCTLRVSAGEAALILDNYPGCIVQVHVDDPVNPIWEGYIDRVTYRSGAVIDTRSLSEMANRVNVTFYNADSPAAIKTEQTAVINNTDSQAIYGVKEISVDAGIHFNNADKTHKTVLRNTFQTQRAFPLKSTVRGNGNGELELEMRGLYEMAWNWQNYLSTNILVPDAGTVINRVVIRSDLEAPLNAPFIYLTATGGMTGTAFTYVSPNLSFNISRSSQSGQTYWQYIQSIAEAGEGVRSWSIGINPPDPNIGSRLIYYRAANATVEYGFGNQDTRIKDTSGTVIPPYLIKPDRGIIFTDLLPGLYTDGNDPSYAYISAVEYDADAQAVDIQSPDGLTMNAVYRRLQYFKGHGQGQFGASVRTVL